MSFQSLGVEMSTPLLLSNELRKLVEKRMKQTLEGIEDTFHRIQETHEIDPKELKADLESLERSFNLIFKKWNLGILYTLFLKSPTGFSEIKNILGVNSRTLSDKLKILAEYEYIERYVSSGPPLRVDYSLTKKGRNTVLLALPLLYSSRISSE